MSPIVALLVFIVLLYVGWKLLKGLLYLAFFAIVGVVILGFVLHSGLVPANGPASAGGVLADARHWASAGSVWLWQAWQHAHG
ncbi:hypothetical protein HAQ00_11705 [Acidithiobacillus caldus ATCC 51756]|jgi:hypothetical protein|uniref:hypothetical protein n=1 Tax=Acidithiobacillus caldus TaxID=33059 RepID=UPI001C076876|nr:hypothetical protein [Acidithiobacillus caldus]MBU2736367.1 hypothetical protein [Acidithiobacillus caldus ATCC 51756]MBU2801025.1 hypothetical protein [Acidithiobacillus caldus]